VKIKPRMLIESWRFSMFMFLAGLLFGTLLSIAIHQRITAETHAAVCANCPCGLARRTCVRYCDGAPNICQMRCRMECQQGEGALCPYPRGGR